MEAKNKQSQRRKKGTGSLRYKKDEGRWEARYKDSIGRTIVGHKLLVAQAHKEAVKP